MDAVTFMDAMKQPREAPPSAPRHERRRFSANAALIAGVGTLLLAMGVGVMIGRSGNGSVATAPPTPQIVKLSGGGPETKTASAGSAVVGGAGKGKSKQQTPKALKKEAETQAGAEEVLKPPPNVKLPPATVQPGGKCPPGSSGCKHGEFTGEFFE